MRDIYEVLNDASENIMPEDMERIELSSYEKKKLMKNLTGQKSEKKPQYWKKTAVAALVLLAGVGAVPVGAAIVNYFNGNTKGNFHEEINEVVAKSTELEGIAEENGTDAAEAVSGIDMSTAGATLTILDVEKDENFIDIATKLTFDEDVDISKLVEACEAEQAEGRFNQIAGSIFENSAVLWDDITIANPAPDDEGWIGVASAWTQDIRFEGNTMYQTLEVMINKDYYVTAEMEKDHVITIRYADLVMGDETFEGEWSYHYTLEADAYEDKELEKAEMHLAATDMYDSVYELDSYAVTANGLKLFGTWDENLEKHLEISAANNGAETSTSMDVRILAWDDLGNQYLMYGMCPDYKEGESKHNMVYSLYEDVSTNEPSDRNYLTEWCPDAKTITVAYQACNHHWENDEWVSTDYELISEPYTIQLQAE